MLQRREMGELTDRERQIVDSLSRPLRHDPDATPATNQEVADEVYLSVDAVKGHLRAVYAKLGLESLPQNEKRARLAALAVAGGIPGVVRRRRRLALLRRRAFLSPALGASALALLAVVALVAIPKGEAEPRGAPPSGGEPDAIATAPSGPAARSGRASRGRELPPIEFAATETVLPETTTTVEGGSTTSPRVRRVVVRRPARRTRPRRTEAPTETQTEEVAPAPAPAPAPKRQARRRRCTVVVKRVVTPKVVWRKRIVTVRHRVPHQRMTRVRKVYWEPHTRVWYDKKGRRHERTRMRRRVRIEMQPVIRWRVKVERKVRRVRTVVRQVRVVRVRRCS